MLTSFSLSLGVLVCYLNGICRSASSAPGYILITLPLCSDTFLDYHFLILKVRPPCKNNFGLPSRSIP